MAATFSFRKFRVGEKDYESRKQKQRDVHVSCGEDRIHVRAMSNGCFDEPGTLVETEETIRILMGGWLFFLMIGIELTTVLNLKTKDL